MVDPVICRQIIDSMKIFDNKIYICNELYKEIRQVIKHVNIKLGMINYKAYYKSNGLLKK